MAVLLRGVVLSFMAVLLRGATRVVMAKLNTCSMRGQVFQKQPSWVRGYTWSRTRVCMSDGKMNWKIKQDSGLVDKDISVLVVIDTNCEIRKVNNEC